MTLALMTEFDVFWKKYPRHVAKLDAMKAYAKARTVATDAEILAGVVRYIAGKPGYADWAYAASWLRAGRWADEYGAPAGGSLKTAGNRAALTEFLRRRGHDVD